MTARRKANRHAEASEGEARRRRSPWTRSKGATDGGGATASPWARGAQEQGAQEAQSSVWARGAAARKQLGFEVPPGIRIGRSPAAARRAGDPGKLAVDLALPIGTSGKGPAPLPGTGYGEMTPDQRADYLAWLASGRQAPTTAKAYIRTYLEGIEHRLLRELGEAPGAPPAGGEAPQLEREIERLEQRYGRDREIEGWCEQILEVWRTSAGRDATASHLARKARPRRLPLDVAVRLGRRAAAGETLSAREAYTWWRLTREGEPDGPQSASERRRRLGFAEALGAHAPEGVRIERRGLGALRQAPYNALSGLFEIDLERWTEGCLDVREAKPPANLRTAAENAGGAAGQASAPGRKAADRVDEAPGRRRPPARGTGEPAGAAEAFVLDEDQLTAARADSAEAAAILGEIFGTSEAHPPRGQTPGAVEPDERHRRLAGELAGRAGWTRSEARAAATAEGLSAGPAVEELNGWTAAAGKGPLASETADGYEINERAARWLSGKAG